ncbi:MAG: BolA family protein [Gammaproteobacteria bacterium]
MTAERVAMIRQRLTAALTPDSLDISDESHLHAGHAGAASGGGHFSVRVVSKRFADQSVLQRHRQIYTALADMMPGHIHALSITAHTPEEQA